MAPRVVHISNEHHAKLKAYARKLGEPMNRLLERWVDGLGTPTVPANAIEKRASTQYTPLDIVDDRTDDLHPYERPPFWVNRKE